MPPVPDADNPHSLFEWRDGLPYFQGLPVERRPIRVGGRTFDIAGLREAADLLDLPEYARRFTEEDIAPYGLELWPSATMLAEHIAHDEFGGGRSAIELGCGLGLVSIAATVRAWNVTATDNDADSLRFAAFNAEANKVSVARYEPLDWNRPPVKRRFSRLFGADVLYQRVDHEPVLGCIDRFLTADGVALLADPRRGVADRFSSVAKEANFAVEVVETHVDADSGRRINGRIFILRRP